jgi:hypothetical protein
MRKRAWMLLFFVAIACDRGSDESASPAPAKEKLVASATPSAPPVASSLAAPAASSAEPPVAESPDAGPLKKTKGPKVELVEAGTEPRRELRYVYKKGQKERIDLTTKTKLGMTMMGKTVDAPATPPVSMIASLEVVSVDGDGTAKRKLAVEKVKMTAAPDPANPGAKELAEQLGNLEKLRGRDEVDSRGVVRAIRMEFAGSDDPQLKQIASSMEQNFGQLGAPFPEEAVGVGAKWRVKTRLEQMGFRLDQTATYKLVALDGDKGKLEITIQQTAPAGKLALPGVPPGASADLESMKGHGTGDVAFELGRTVPFGNMETTADIKVKIDMAGQTQSTSMKMTMNVSLKPAK